VKLRRKLLVFTTVISVALGVVAVGAQADTAACAITTPTTFDTTSQIVNNPHSMYNSIIASGAPTYYQGGFFGQGIDVAVIDTGVAPVPGLNNGNVINGPDLSFESNNPALAHLDTFGHGTHMASIIAGRDPGWTYFSPSVYQGIAPLARVVSVKVGDSMGAVDVTQIIAGIDWVVTHRRDPGMNIRVLSLSLGLHAQDAYANDALAFAVEQAWKNGIVVLASAGNEGVLQSDGTVTGLLSPAYNADMIAVASYDPATLTASKFSQLTTVGQTTPSLAAPGQSIQGLRAPGSYEDTEVLADCATAMATTGTWTQPIWGPGGRFINGSGTSQATAMAAGAAALILSQHPNLNPDQVKWFLEASSSYLPKSNWYVTGSGGLNLTAAYNWTVPYSFSHQYVVGGNGLDQARGDSVLTDKATGRTLSGNQDWLGGAFVPAGYNNSVQNDEPQGHAWKLVKDPTGKYTLGESWNGHFLTGEGFVSDPVLGQVWSGHSWAGNDWAGQSFTGHSWGGHSWANNHWTGTDWESDSFTGHSWAGHSWGDFSWS
jgi:serine protease AprX